MKQLITILALLTLTNSISAQDKLEWNAKTKLTVNDFKGSNPDAQKPTTLKAGFGMEANLKGEAIKNLKSFNGQVSNFFLTTESWSDWREDSRLRYAITLFDLNEWQARELRKRLNENRQLVLSGNYEQIRVKVQEEFHEIHEDYAAESDDGNNVIGQLKWETKIAEQLAVLSAYCKACVPKD